MLSLPWFLRVRQFPPWDVFGSIKTPLHQGGNGGAAVLKSGCYNRSAEVLSRTFNPYVGSMPMKRHDSVDLPVAANLQRFGLSGKTLLKNKLLNCNS